MNMTNFEIYCKDFIRENIEGLIGRTIDFCDLGYEITNGINADGSCTYSTNLAKQYLSDWWDECADYFNFETNNFGKVFHNPFENPEAFMACMVIEGVRLVLDSIEYVQGQIEITQELCDNICSQLDEIEMYNSRGYVNW